MRVTLGLLETLRLLRLLVDRLFEVFTREQRLVLGFLREPVGHLFFFAPASMESMV